MPSMNYEETAPFPVTDDNHPRNDKREPHSQDMLCGIGPFTPRFLQPCKRMGLFTAAYSASAVFTSCLNTYIASQVTTIEKQFGFSSSETGFLLSCNDIGFLLSIMFASYAANRVHIPRSLWASTALYGFGALICSLAFFISKSVFQRKSIELGTATNNASKVVAMASWVPPLCTPEAYFTNNSSQCRDDGDEFVAGHRNQFSGIAMFLIALGMVIQGITKSPRTPFCVTYVDDNGKKKNTAMYLGIITATGITGAAIAFTFGGIFSRIYVTLEDVSISPLHPSWVGAWWLGFLVFGILAAVVSLPLLCFPRRMKPKEALKGKAKEANGIPLSKHRTESNMTLAKYVTGILKSTLRLLRNRVYMLVVAIALTLMFMTASMSSFAVKYLETQFFLPVWTASFLTGLMGVIPISLGTVTSGLVITKRRLTPVQCIKLIIGLSVSCLVIVSFGYLLGCSNPDIVGLNTDRNPDSSNATVCGTDCNCDTRRYFPVCGSDGRNYFSPCVAGCQKISKMVFTGCGCIGHNATAVPGLCQTKCNMLLPYISTFVVNNFLGGMQFIPLTILTIRSVRIEDKSMAIGFSTLLVTLFGWLLGPVVFGLTVDATCRIWTRSCLATGACALYDNDLLRAAKSSFEVGPRTVVVILSVCLCLAAMKKTDWSSDNTDRETVDTKVELANDGAVHTKALID